MCCPLEDWSSWLAHIVTLVVVGGRYIYTVGFSWQAKKRKPAGFFPLDLLGHSRSKIGLGDDYEEGVITPPKQRKMKWGQNLRACISQFNMQSWYVGCWKQSIFALHTKIFQLRKGEPIYWLTVVVELGSDSCIFSLLKVVIIVNIAEQIYSCRKSSLWL